MELDRLRTGLGTDVHRLKAGAPLWLGGLHIESPYGCEAHSDGDALLHALIDALLGATKLGDIGQHFPPSDERWRNAESKALLKHTLGLIRAQHPDFKIINVDAVVHLQAPKLGPYRAALQASMAELLGLEASRVSVKFKTGEALYPIGTHEAIETQVVLLMAL